MRKSLAALLALAACGPPALRADLRGETTVQGNPNQPQLTTFPTIGSLSNLDLAALPDLKSQNVDPDQVSSVKVDLAKVKVLSPPEQDLSFLDSLTLLIRAGDSETVIAEKSGIASLGLSPPNPTLVLEVKSVELRPYLKGPPATILGRAKGRHPVQDTRIEAAVGLRFETAAF
ncbi:MAG: hypothetical protein HYZ28_06915 [Myxococcales bacterium]|nr:hypothetical protein [Myxococcales bacterium]